MVIRNFWRENVNFFLKTDIRKFGRRKLFSVPPNSAPSLRLCSTIYLRNVRHKLSTRYCLIFIRTILLTK